jgi:uncharacterized protein YndB with AHSA1/START domain
MPTFTLTREVAAPPDVVFDVLTDHRGYAALTPVRRSVLEREGVPAPNGLGAIRALHAVGPPIREEVIAYEPPRRFGYKILSGAPVKEQVGDVTLEPKGAGTRVVYRIDMTPSLRGTGPAVAMVMRAAINALLRGVAQESERRAGVTGAA